MSLTIAELETPVPVVDLDRLARNLDRAAAYATEHGLALAAARQDAQVAAHRRRAARARRRRAHLRDAVRGRGDERRRATTSSSRIRRSARARADASPRCPTHVRLTVALDSRDGDRRRSPPRRARPIAESASTSSSTSACIASACRASTTPSRSRKRVSRAPPLDFAGIAFYPGHVREPVDAAGREARAARRARSRATLDAFDRAGVDAATSVSGGSTPTLWRTHEIARRDRVPPGHVRLQRSHDGGDRRVRRGTTARSPCSRRS